MASEQKNQALAAQLMEWTKAGQIGAIEETWIEQIQTLPSQGAFYKEWIKAMRRAAITP